MAKLAYIRKGHLMIEVNDDGVKGKTEEYPSINEAKRASMTFQKANGGLGMGSVQVLPHKPKKGI